MPTADKRQRKKENARLAREAREAQIKKRRRNRTLRNAAIAGAVFAAAILIITYVSGDDKKVAVSPTSVTTSTTRPTSTTVAKSPAATVPASDLAKVKCNDTKPPAPASGEKLTAPAQTIDPNRKYVAVISTSCGFFSVTLDAKNAPKGVNNFVYLARSGFYDGLTWHRVAKDFVIQGGDPAGNGSGSPGYESVTELPKDGYPLGTLAWAKTGSAPAGSAGSQFFVVTSDHPVSLEQKQNGSYQYGVFGHVSDGIEVAKKMEGFAPASGDGAPTRPLYIFRVVISEE